VLIDLHTHSNASDGTDSPSELVAKARLRGLGVIALTDHDTIHGWNEAKSELQRVEQKSDPLQLVLGAEVSCQNSDGISIHILALLFDGENKPLVDEMNKTRENRLTRMEKIIARLNGAGIEISMSEVHAQRQGEATLGRPHLADALIAKGYFQSRDEVFAALLHNRSKYYVSHYSPSPELAIRLIKEAGGVAVIAHPLASHRGRVIPLPSLDQMVNAGLDGIEVDHRDHSQEERVTLKNFARERNLIITGSSDYHGDGKLNQLAEFTTHPEQWEALRARANKDRVVRV